jgi:hypothetical protein
MFNYTWSLHILHLIPANKHLYLYVTILVLNHAGSKSKKYDSQNLQNIRRFVLLLKNQKRASNPS